MSAYRIWVNSQEVSGVVVREDLPEYLETSVKGPGFFEFRMEPFTFRMQAIPEIAGVLDAMPQIGQSCRITIDDEVWLDGVISDITDAYTSTPEVEAVPFGAALSDVKAGQQKTGSDGRLRWEFEIPTGSSVQDAAELLLSRFNDNKPANMAGVDWDVSVVGDTTEFLDEYVAYGLTQNVKAGEVGNYFASHALGAWEQHGLTPPDESERVEIRRPAAGNLTYLGARRVMFSGVGGGWAERVSVWAFNDAGVTGQNAAGWLGYFTPEQWRGEVAGFPTDFGSIVANTSAHVTELQAELYTGDEEQAGNAFVDCFARYDAPDGTWTWCRLTDEEGRVLVYAVWWANPIEQYIQGRFFNRSMGEMLQIMALITGRWIKITGSTVTLIARRSQANIVTLPDEGLAIEYEQQKKQVTPPGVNVPIWYGGTDEGLSGGWTPSQVAALNRWYNDGFAGIETQTESVYLSGELPSTLQLLSKEADLGTVIGLDRSLNGKKTRLRLIAEGGA